MSLKADVFLRGQGSLYLIAEYIFTSQQMSNIVVPDFKLFPITKVEKFVKCEQSHILQTTELGISYSKKWSKGKCIHIHTHTLIFSLS